MPATAPDPETRDVSATPPSAPASGLRARVGVTRRRSWGPVALSFGLHGVLLLAALVWFEGRPTPVQEPRSLLVSAMAFVEPEACDEDAVEDIAPCETPPEAYEVTIPEEFFEVETAFDDCELPECDFEESNHRPVDMPDVPLTAARQSRPTPVATPTPPDARPTPRVRLAARAPVQRRSPRGRPLKLLHRPNLMNYYPAEARRRGIEGEALVEIQVDARGVVVDAKIVRSSGSALLDRQALRVMYDYRFAPGDGGRSRVPVNFRLR